MPAIDFAWPAVLFLLLVVPVVVLAMLRGLRSRNRADLLYGGGADLRVGRSDVLRGLRAALFIIALIVLIVGVARPRWGDADAVIEQRGIDVAIALDVSRSMEAPDIAPTRAEAIVEGLRQMLPHMQGNRVGLTIFGESAFERAPLTLDLTAISTLLGRAQAESALVDPGTSLAVGIEAALEVLDVDDPAHAQAIILASDGEDLSGIPFEDAIAAAAERGIPVFTLYAGTGEPSALPEVAGHEDITTADRSTMEAIAAGTGAAVREPQNVAGLAVEFRRMRQTAFEVDIEQARVERFSWFVGAGLVLLVLQAMVPEATTIRRTRPRRGVMTAGIGGLALFIAGCSGTLVWQYVDLGNQAYLETRYDDALAHYLDAAEAAAESEHLPAVEYNTSNTLHQLLRYDEAVERALAGIEGDTHPDLGLRLRYALGNHYFRLGDLERARDAYIGALRLDPTDRDSKANLELVLRELEPPPPPEETPPPVETPEPGEPNGPDDGNGEGEQPGEDPNGEPGDPANGEPGEQPGEDPQPGDNGEEPPDGPPDTNGNGGEPGSPTPADSLEDLRERLEHMLGELGDELTAEEVALLIELYQRMSELDRLPGAAPQNGSPPR